MKTRLISAVLTLLVSMLVALSIPTEAQAQDNGLAYRGWGVRGGFSISPDQIFFGAHLDLGEFAEGWHFIPNADIGFGDNQTVFTISPDVTYHFPVRDIGALYAGGLLALEWWHFDGYRHHVDDTEGKVGLHGIGGLLLDEVPVFFELNVGLLDAPDLKLAVGYTFPQ